MKTVPFDQFKSRIDYYINLVDEKGIEICVRMENGRQVVLVPIQSVSTLKETAYLLSSEANAKHLFKSIDQANNGETVPFDF